MTQFMCSGSIASYHPEELPLVLNKAPFLATSKSQHENMLTMTKWRYSLMRRQGEIVQVLISLSVILNIFFH